ncbi:MAG: winged helix-turn-helix transcriptional regulator, partial [Oscillospiraceae bacterium]|nr:winged helix-turn-helix transcriptional regulator [Oscillospiraceae bacterium]
MDEMLDEIERYVRYCVDNHAGMPAMEIIGSKWLIRILFHLCRRSPLRFGQIKRIIPEISNAALATG